MTDSVFLDQPLSFPPEVSDFAAERLEAFFMGHSLEALFAQLPELPAVASPAETPLAAAGEETEPGEPEADLSPTEVTPTEDYCDEDGDELESTPRAKSPSVSLTLSRVREVQGLSLREAAAACFMGTTQFKLQCRKLGVARWPHRQVKSLQSLLASCRALSRRDATADAKLSLDAWLVELEKLQLKTMEGVLDDLPAYVEKIRAWTIKQRSMAKRKLVKASSPLVYVPPPPQALFA